jgi:antitoxin VapB
MIATAKIRTSDQHQTVQLPTGFELGANEVWVRKDEATGEVILTPMTPDPNRRGLETLFRLLDDAPLPDNFLIERANPVETPRDPLVDWPE